MECREELNFHDDSSRAVEKAKESILLMKKKMFRSHDLILQYNNKLKECDRLKGDLCLAQEETTNIKRENNTNLSKIVKLEAQILEWKKSQLLLEQKVADQDVQIAGDKAHVKQLICKLENIEAEHLAKLVEVDLQKSSLEVRVKELEQVLKKQNKSHHAQILKLEKSIVPQKVQKISTKSEISQKVTIDIGVNTDEQPVQVKHVKPMVADKSILTDEFYHTKNNPYPIFCDRCEITIVPSVEKICKIMTSHPPLLEEMLSPPPSTAPKRPRVDTTSNLRELLPPVAMHGVHERPEILSNIIPPEIDNLKRKIATLERKIKKQKKSSREPQLPNGGWCGHSYPSKCCTHSSSIPDIQPQNIQQNLMTKFWDKVMEFTNGSLPKPDPPRVRGNKLSKIKLLKKRKYISRKNKCQSSTTTFEIEPDLCHIETQTQNVEWNSNMLRIKPTEEASDELPEYNLHTAVKNPNERLSFSETNDEFMEKDEESETELNRQPRTKDSESPKSSGRKPKDLLFHDNTEIASRSGKNAASIKKVAAMSVTQNSERRSSSRIQERKKLQTRKTKIKNLFSTSERLSTSSDAEGGDREPMNSLLSSAPTSPSISSDIAESAYHSQSSILDESASTYVNSKHISRSSTPSKNSDLTSVNDTKNQENSTSHNSASELEDSHNFINHDENLSDVGLEHYSDLEIPKCTASHPDPGTNTRKRKRSNSLTKSTKQTRTAKLMTKLRALKKNSIRLVAKTSPPSNNDNCSSSRINTSNESEAKVVENEKMRSPKKQRIAHIPKKVSCELNVVTENVIAKDTKMDDENSSEIVKRDEKIAVPCSSPSVEVSEFKEVKSVENNEAISMEVQKSPEIPEKNSTSTAPKISAVDESQTEVLIQAEVPPPVVNADDEEKIKKTNVSKSRLLTPAACPSTRHQLPVPSINLTIPVMPARVARNLPIKIAEQRVPSNIVRLKRNSFNANISVKVAESSESKEISTPSPNPCLLEKRKEVPSCSSVIEATDTSELPARTPATIEIPQNTSNSSVTDETKSIEKISELPDELPISREPPTFSPASPTGSSFETDFMSPPKKVEDRLTIYNRVELPIPQSVPSTSTLSDNITSQVPNTERNLLIYNTALFDSNEEKTEYVEELVSPSISEAAQSNNYSINLEKVKQLRTRQILCSSKTPAGQHSPEKNHNMSNEDGKVGGLIDPATYQRGVRSLSTLLYRHLGEEKIKRSKKKGPKHRKGIAIKLYTDAVKIVKNELYNLVEGEVWSSELQASVITKLCQLSSPRTVSKSIVEFLMERANDEEPMDRTYTPPAPVMTKTQQRIIAMINVMERDAAMPGIFDLVAEGINYNIFKVGNLPVVEVIDYLVRMFTVMMRLKKDRERVRILCCDVCYCLGWKAINALYTIFTIWPEVFPVHGANEDALTKCIVHLIRTEQNSKSTGAKRMLKVFYNYPECSVQPKDLMKELISSLTKKYSVEVEMALLLLTKRQGFQWTYKNVVSTEMMKIIEDPTYPWLYEALSLLGFMMRAKPNDEDDTSVATVVEKFAKMITSVDAPLDQQEGLASALLSLSRYYQQYNKIADAILTWKPTATMRPRTIEQLNVFFKLRHMEWWDTRKREKIRLKLEA